jgi:4-diphosphocytidyl-2-C-methyl-D-erythritol kinase
MLPIVATDGAWLAPAKLNLMLRVVGRRADGYHLLQTVFQFVDRCDRLYFDVRNDGRVIRRSGAPGVSPDQDLVVRAAQALRAWTGCTKGITIDVQKILPIGGGLGGGSSDAATTLVALNQLWSLGLEIDVLAQIGLSLGADIPVFVHGRAAWAEGVGEYLTPMEPPEPWYLILAPAVSVSTAMVFSDPGLTRNSRSVKMEDFIAGCVENDCLNVVLTRYPAVAEAFTWLKLHAGTARLTGTGGCVFAEFSNKGTALEVAEIASRKYSAFVARGCNLSPLFETPGHGA